MPTAIPGAEAWRIAYVSSDVQERKTISTAIVVAPKGPAPKDGRPIVAWAHGTTGTAENCGPSQVPNPAQPLNQYFLIDGNSWTDYGLPAVEDFIRQGYVVVGTDYQGLGGGGAHQYAVAATQGRDVINSIRAAGSMGPRRRRQKKQSFTAGRRAAARRSPRPVLQTISRRKARPTRRSMVGFVAMAPDDVAAVAPKGALDEAARGQNDGRTYRRLLGQRLQLCAPRHDTCGRSGNVPGPKC